MKLKFVYGLFAALAAVGMTACSADEGTIEGNDPKPVVTIYTYAAPDAYNPDQTAYFRMAPNNKVTAIYVLAELQTEYEANLASMGNDGYMQYVVANGTRYDAATQDVAIEGLQGAYEISVVAQAANGVCTKASFYYKGIRWIPAGTTWAQENIVGLSGYVDVERQDDANIFRVIGYHSQLDPEVGDPDEVFTFTFNAAHELTGFDTSNAPYIMTNFEDEDGWWFGYWNTSSYANYCYTGMASASGIPVAAVTLLVLENNAGSLYTGGKIYLWTDGLEFCE